MKLIKLTSHFKGLSYYVNADKIVSFNRSDSAERTAIYFDGEDNSMLVNETPEEIIKLINNE